MSDHIEGRWVSEVSLTSVKSHRIISEMPYDLAVARSTQEPSYEPCFVVVIDSKPFPSTRGSLADVAFSTLVFIDRLILLGRDTVGLFQVGCVGVRGP